MAGQPTVWVTRAQPGADATAARLQSLGRVPWVWPLLTVEALPGAADALQEARACGVGALAFTSANAVRAFAALEPERSVAVFAVGDATARAAHAAGFADVRSAQGDVAALAAVVAAAAPSGEVVHAGAESPAGDLVGALRAAGVAARALALYRTVVNRPGPDVEPPAALDTVLLHSPRAAGVLAGVLARGWRGVDPGALDVLGLSPACVAPLRRQPFRSLRAADAPCEDALLRLSA